MENSAIKFIENSQAVVNTMEVLETKPISELVSEAIIKVCYVSDLPNRNQTVITKDVGRQIAATLPGAPVVGFFNEETQDFVEHSHQIIIEDGEVHFKELTRPYGFVGFDQPWYQDFIEDGTTRTYLMCRAYLWTRQYEEAKQALGKGQSMELDPNSMCGYYEGDVFVYTQATLDKLCILGEGYSPCFEGASIVSAYSQGYTELTNQIENVLGRRYYVMKDHLSPGPRSDYSIALGWNLTEAIRAQLTNRGMGEDYMIEGVYQKGEEVFAILQNNVSLEFLKISVKILPNDTVELGTDMVAVTMEWVPKAPQGEDKVDPVRDDPVDSTTDPTSNVSSSTTTTNLEPGPAPSSVPSSYMKEDEPMKTGENVEPAATQFADNGSEPSVTESTSAPATTFVATSEDNTEDLATVTTRFTELQASLEQRIQELERQNQTYAQKLAEQEEDKKEQVISTYSKVLSEDEMKTIVEKRADYSAVDMEKELAVTFARKSFSAPAAAPQVNVSQDTVSPDSTLPNFMLQALEYDKTHTL